MTCWSTPRKPQQRPSERELAPQFALNAQQCALRGLVAAWLGSSSAPLPAVVPEEGEKG